MKKPSTPSKASAVSRGNDLGFLHPKQPATFFNDYPSPCGGGMPPCGSDGSLPSRPQWTALFDIVLSVFSSVCAFFRLLLLHNGTKGSYANAKTALPDTSSRQQRLRDGQDSAPDLATSCLRSYAQYKILKQECDLAHAHARPTMPSISLVYI